MLILWQRANHLAFLGRSNEAILDYRKCLEIDNTHVAARFSLGSELHDAGKFYEALGEYQIGIDQFEDLRSLWNKRLLLQEGNSMTFPLQSSKLRGCCLTQIQLYVTQAWIR